MTWMFRQKRMLLTWGAICAINLSWDSNPQFLKPDLTKLAQRAVSRTATVLQEPGKQGLRVSEGNGHGLVWIPNVRFATGTIQLDVRGKDVFQGSFLGIAFRGLNDQQYEVVYLRPFNFRTQDTVRHSHAIQYAVHPDFPWARLRKERPDEFENSVGSDLDPNGWVHLRVEVFDDRIRAFVGAAEAPVLEASRLKTSGEGMIGLWVGEGSGGDFANLKVQSTPRATKVELPVNPEVFIERFQAAEGITFNGEGRLFIGADHAVWLAEPNGSVRKITDVYLCATCAMLQP